MAADRHALDALHRLSVRYVTRLCAASGLEPLAVVDDDAFSAHLHVSEKGYSARISVWADPYAGDDPTLAARRDLVFYRARARELALPRDAGRGAGTPVGIGVPRLVAYHRLAVPFSEADLEALLRERDEILFDEVGVTGDSLLLVDATHLREWLASHASRFPSRPVTRAGDTSWLALVDEAEVMAGVASARHVGSISGPPDGLPVVSIRS